MNDGWMQSSLTDIIGWTDILTMEAYEQAVSVLLIFDSHVAVD